MSGDVVDATPVEATPHVDPTHALGLHIAEFCGDPVRLNEFGEIARHC